MNIDLQGLRDIYALFHETFERETPRTARMRERQCKVYRELKSSMDFSQAARGAFVDCVAHEFGPPKAQLGYHYQVPTPTPKYIGCPMCLGEDDDCTACGGEYKSLRK